MVGIVNSESVRCAGDEIDQAIIKYLKSQYSVVIGENTAEQVKLTIGAAVAPADELRMPIKGRDLRTGLPHQLEISSTEIAEAIRPQVQTILGAIKMVLERTAPELASDLIERGITMAGGTSQLRGLADLIARETRLPVYVANDPMTCVARGCAALLDDLDALKQILEAGVQQ
jgi:rod shape-determining protein MreB